MKGREHHRGGYDEGEGKSVPSIRLTGEEKWRLVLAKVWVDEKRHASDTINTSRGYVCTSDLTCTSLFYYTRCRIVQSFWIIQVISHKQPFISVYAFPLSA